MPRKRKLSNLGDRCRLCLARDACMSSLLADWIRPKLDDLEKCAAVEILDKPNYPKSICYVCLYKLEMWSEFKSQFLKTNKTLLTHFKVVDPPANEADKSLRSEETADDLTADNSQKRAKIDVCEPEEPTSEAPEKPPTTAPTIPEAPPTKPSPVEPPPPVPEPIVEDATHTDPSLLTPGKEDNNGTASVTKTQPSDGSVTTARKSAARPKKIEREASTKRWEERKNALIAATGELSSESDSDDKSSQLSPVQKARAKSNSEKEIEMQRRKIAKALKNLETNMTEKYRVNREEIDGGKDEDRRKTRSRRGAVEESKVEAAKTEKNEKKVEVPKVDPKDKSKKKEVKENLKSPTKEPQKQSTESKEAEKQPTDTKQADEQPATVKESAKKPSVVQDTTKESESPSTAIKHPVKEAEKQPSIARDTNERSDDTPASVPATAKQSESQLLVPTESNDRSVPLENSQDDVVEIVDLDDDDDDNAMDLDVVPTEKKESTNVEPFVPQLVTSEVSIGSATYVVTTMLDMPGLAGAEAAKSDISLKTNGINIDATSQDGGKIDLMNAVQLQRVQGSKNNQAPSKRNNTSEDAADVQKCLKIEIEGMEVGALQRVQLELAHFVQEEIRQRVIDETPTAIPKTDSKTSKFKDTYETLDHQVKTIIEKVLRSNYEADRRSGILSSLLINNKRISHEFVKAATQSHVFQPKVKVSRMNVGKLCKLYRINNLHILESAKRQRGLVGPLSRTLGKRRHVLPKKYDGFTLSLKPDEAERALMAPIPVSKPSKTTVTGSSKPTDNNSSLSMSSLSMDFGDSNASVPSFMPTVIAPKTMIDLPVMTPTTTQPSPLLQVAKSSTGLVVVMAGTGTGERTVTTQPVASSTPLASKTRVSMVTTKQVIGGSAGVNRQKSLAVNSTPAVYKAAPPATAPAVLPSLAPLPNRLPVKSNLTPIKPMGAKPIVTLNNSPPKTMVKRQRHICGICGKELFSKEEAEMHVKNHKLELSPPKVLPPPTPILEKTIVEKTIVEKTMVEKTMVEKTTIMEKTMSPPPPPPPPRPMTPAPAVTNSMPAPTPLLESTRPKPKLMRCKRCQAIVEARHVKSHGCDSVKYNCRLCDCSFGAEHLLVAHLETHTQQPSFARPPAAPVKPNAAAVRTTTTTTTTTTAMVKQNATVKTAAIAAAMAKKNSPTKEAQRLRMMNNDSQPEQEEDLEELLGDKEPQGYSCFVCDKVFVDEEQMKDHLQMHCEEISDDGNEKGFQCAFCGEKFQTEESLESHVGNHLLEDGDEKINMLISLDTRRDRQRQRSAPTVFKCEQCSESFASSLLLAMHLPLHEEEEAAMMLIEYNKKQQQQQEEEVVEEEVEQDHHVCTICDEIFDTPDELSEHLDVHNGNAHVCILCEKPFTSIRDLQQHVSTHL